MPIYEYRCDGCHARVDVLVRGGESGPSCPHCGTALTTKLFSTPYISKGLASRQPGRTCCGQAERCDAPPCSTGETCRHES
jgi:putative FmdB family regulatory protein